MAHGIDRDAPSHTAAVRPDPRARAMSRYSSAARARDIRWRIARRQAEAMARREVKRLDTLLAKLDPVTQANRRARMTAQRGKAMHELRMTLRLDDWMEHLRRTSPARYEELLKDPAEPDDPEDEEQPD